MAIGGFSGLGGQITLAQFKSYTRREAIHYYLSGGGQIPGPGDLGGTGAIPGPGDLRGAGEIRGPDDLGGQFAMLGGHLTEITKWVRAHYDALTIDGETLYDLTRAKAR
jgi:hypothetical protein